MIDIQIVEHERQPGQPVTFTLLIACASQPDSARDLSREPQNYDLICSIEARSTLSATDLDSPFDFIQGVFGCDEPWPDEPAASFAAFTPFRPQACCRSAAGLPLAVLENA